MAATPPPRDAADPATAIAGTTNARATNARTAADTAIFDTAHSSTASAGAIRALQTALAAEHAAVYGYGVVGAHLSGGARAAATRDFRRHRARRDALRRMLTDRGATPVAARGAYKLPFPVRHAAGARRLAAHLETAVSAAYLPLVAVSDHGLRKLGAAHVTSATERSLDWGANLTAFPALPASALR